MLISQTYGKSNFAFYLFNNTCLYNKPCAVLLTKFSNQIKPRVYIIGNPQICFVKITKHKSSGKVSLQNSSNFMKIWLKLVSHFLKTSADIYSVQRDLEFCWIISVKNLRLCFCYLLTFFASLLCFNKTVLWKMWFFSTACTKLGN